MKKMMIVVVAAVLAACGCVSAQKSETTFVKDAIQPFVDSGELPGAISILIDGDREEIACVGYSDIDTKRPISLDDHFMQCSQTKGFCGVTIAKLVEEGKISLDDKVSKYLPEFKNQGEDKITIRMCLNHMAGFNFELPNIWAMGGWSRRMPLRSVATMAAAFPLKFEPGTAVQYSNVGIDVGAAVVEVVTGMRWEDYLKKEVLDPLGMKASSFKPTDEQLNNRIMLYNLEEGKAPVYHVSGSMMPPWNDDRVFASAGAGLWTTARDQVKFYKMLMNLGIGDNGVRILKEETVKNLLSVSSRVDVKTNDWTKDGYSLGLSAPTKANDGENAFFGHGGAWGSNCSVNWRKKQLKLWVVQLCGNPRPWDKVVYAAQAQFFNAKQDNSGVDAYTGRMK